jgi:hypothetical protein
MLDEGSLENLTGAQPEKIRLYKCIESANERRCGHGVVAKYKGEYRS